MISDRDIYTDKYRLQEDLLLLNATQVQELAEQIAEIKGNYDNKIIQRVLDTLIVNSIYCLGLNVLSCNNN